MNSMDGDMVRCDKCSTEFIIKLMRFNHHSNFQIHYFMCPDCKTKFMHDITNDKIISNMKKAKKLSLSGTPKEVFQLLEKNEKFIEGMYKKNKINIFKYGFVPEGRFKQYGQET